MGCQKNPKFDFTICVTSFSFFFSSSRFLLAVTFSKSLTFFINSSYRKKIHNFPIFWLKVFIFFTIKLTSWAWITPVTIGFGVLGAMVFALYLLQSMKIQGSENLSIGTLQKHRVEKVRNSKIIRLFILHSSDFKWIKFKEFVLLA